MRATQLKLLLGFVAINGLLLLVALALWSSRPTPPPQIQGVLLPQAKVLQGFTLRDHHGQTFSNRDLLGQWHIVSYGFTHCPDVCPTTLHTLVELIEQLQSEGRAPLQVLFYTVDHRRDTSTALNTYLPFFHPDFVGLTHLDDSDNPHLPFELGLGILARLEPLERTSDSVPDADDYAVLHGITLLLLNPEGQLQAVFQPGRDLHGTQVFSTQQLYQDYLQIRNYLDQPQLAALPDTFGSAP